MKRRELLTAMGLGLLWPPAPPSGGNRPDGTPWTFRLDGKQRWSLVAKRGPTAVAGAELTVQLADGESTALGRLGNVRRFQLADARGAHAGWHVVGVLAGVEVAAQFLDGPPPLITVAVRGLDVERVLDEVRFFDTATARIPALAGGPSPATRPATAWVNGYQSWDACDLVRLDADVNATGHWQLAAIPASARTDGQPGATAGLALAFGADDAGEGRFTLAGRRIVAATRFDGRAVGLALAPAVASLAIVPGKDPLAELGRLAAAGHPATASDVPTGWCSWYELLGRVSEADVLANLEVARARFGPRLLQVIQLDDGFQRAAGDWDANDKFPHGHRWLTDRIHAAGFRAGLWLAPFAVAERSGIPAAHPEWLLETPAREPLVLADRGDWGGKIYGLDAAQAAVRDFLRELARHAVTVWGYDYLKLDFLHYGAQGTRRDRRSSPAEAYRAGLRALREGAGRAFVLGCGAPLQHAVGMVDGMRIGADVSASIGGVRLAARAATLRAHLHKTAWLNDPDCLLMREPLEPDEARAWATVVALSGGMALSSDVLSRLPADRIEILKRVFPVAPVRARALDLLAGNPERDPPGWLLSQVRDDWWMLAIVNWGNQERRLSLSLGDHGLRGPLAAYDVWAASRRADVDSLVALSVPRHAATVLSLRRKRRVPFVIGSTRHVVQGVVDLADERWDSRRRVLAARAVRLDGRPYTVTIALPPGFQPKRASCDSDAGVALETERETRAARLVFATPAGEELSWELEF